MTENHDDESNHIADDDLDSLLARASRKYDVVPAELGNRVKRRIQGRSHRVAWGLAGAVAAAVLVSSVVFDRPELTTIFPRDTRSPMVSVPDVQDAGSARNGDSIWVDAGTSAIVMPLPAKKPNVSVFMVYPMKRPATAGSEKSSQVFPPTFEKGSRT
jgi:hypothetical protein